MGAGLVRGFLTSNSILPAGIAFHANHLATSATCGLWLFSHVASPVMASNGLADSVYRTIQSTFHLANTNTSGDMWTFYFYGEL